MYANEQNAEDTGASASLELSQKAQVLGTRLGEATSFIQPEILGLGKEKVGRFFAQDAALKIYRRPVDEILRAAPHTLDANGEAIVAAFGLSSESTSSIYRIFSNAELPWPTVKLSDGTEAKLDQSGYAKYRESENRGDRKKVFDAFWGKWKEFEGTFGVTFYERLKQDTVYAKVRH